MRGVLPVVLVLCVVVSGCLGGPEEVAPSAPQDPAAGADGAPEGAAGAAAGTDEESTPEEVFHTYSEIHAVSVSGTSSPVLHGSNSNNCLRFEEGLERVLRGNVTVTWTAESSFSEDLELVIWDEGSPLRAAGTSPIHASFGPPWGKALGVAVQAYGDLAVVSGQEVEVDVRFDYEGAPVLEPGVLSCSWG